MSAFPPALGFALAVVAAYLAGSIPASYLAGRLLCGIDLRRHGSGNLGATNVYRALGLLPAAAVVLVDVGKGWLAAAVLPGLAAALVGVAAPGELGAGGGSALLSVHGWDRESAGAWGILPIVCGMAAVLGHVYPVWLGFRGGKGVATGVGVFLALSPLATLGAVALWAAIVALTRIVSIASLALGVFLPLLVFAEQAERGAGTPWRLVAFAALAAVFIFWTHRENLRRLARGEERRIARAPSQSQPPGTTRTGTPPPPGGRGGAS